MISLILHHLYYDEKGEKLENAYSRNTGRLNAFNRPVFLLYAFSNVNLSFRVPQRDAGVAAGGVASLDDSAAQEVAADQHK